MVQSLTEELQATQEVLDDQEKSFIRLTEVVEKQKLTPIESPHEKHIENFDRMGMLLQAAQEIYGDQEKSFIRLAEGSEK